MADCLLTDRQTGGIGEELYSGASNFSVILSDLDDMNECREFVIIIYSIFPKIFDPIFRIYFYAYLYIVRLL